MPMKRKNKAQRDTDHRTPTQWFVANKKRQRKRAKAQKASRRRNRT